jgi:hypothetical protein
MAFFQSCGIVALFNVISSNLAGPTDFLLPIAATLFLVSLVLIINRQLTECGKVTEHRTVTLNYVSPPVDSKVFHTQRTCADDSHCRECHRRLQTL